ncbi:MAG TPA: bifunctional oligoribonuclease/PAP phosphatase NrnA [Fimbriimonadaceae bacterium]|nr:bifunctional oligoribonuclease/PAP phosphatase NrnA [Fimbriimonadaceae bacterium]
MGIVQELAPEFLTAVQSASSVLIGTHLNPDGDALGSALAVSHWLDAMGIANEVLCHHMPPRNLRFLPGVSRIRQTPKEDKYDLGIVVDLDSLERLGNTEPFFSSCERTIFIDHHVPHDAPGDIRIVDTAAPATAVILTRLMHELQVEISPDIATCLITGIVTDTGSFRFRNTTPESLSLAAQLLEQGGNINLVSEQVFQSKPISSARLLGYALERMCLDCDDRICWSVLTIDDFEQNHATDEDTEGFVNELLTIETVQISAILREPKRGKIRCSLRSRGAYDVAAVARTFGGGGHRNAAGCNFEGAVSDAVEQLVVELKRCLESC